MWERDRLNNATAKRDLYKLAEDEEEDHVESPESTEEDNHPSLFLELKKHDLAIAGKDIPPQLSGRRIKRWDFDPSTAERIDLPDYVTRNSGDPFPRLELPADLKPFMRENKAEQALLVLTGEVKDFEL